MTVLETYNHVADDVTVTYLPSDLVPDGGEKDCPQCHGRHAEVLLREG